MNTLKLFEGISKEDVDRMSVCFEAKRVICREGDIIDVESRRDYVGVVGRGSLNIEKCDESGNGIFLERIDEGGIFGACIAFPETFCAVAQSDCEVVFFPYASISKPCVKLCDCHMRLIDNMLAIMSQKTMGLSERVSVLTSRTIREKLLHFFNMQAAKSGKPSFDIDMTTSELADYICADRSAMCRELKRMCDDGIIKKNRRKISLLKYHEFFT